MAGVILVTLTFATLASGAQYVDYSGVKMPQYGGNSDYDGPRDVPATSDDYHDHSPDAPAPLDYKYEEDVNGKTNKALMKDLEETEDWLKPQKKHRRPRPIDDSNIETLDKYSPDETVPNFKASHRFSKHRPRLKARKTARADSVGLKRPVNYVRIRDTEMSNIDSKDDFRDDKVDEFEDDESSFVYKETTMRVARRKPRDRFVQNRRGGEDMQRERNYMEPDKLIERRLIPKDEMGRNLQYHTQNEEEPGAPLETFRNPSNPYATNSDEEDAAVIRPLLNQKDDAEYSEYYDMNRVHNIKNKLPSLLRRTTKARTTPSRRKTTFVSYEVMPLRRADALAPFPEPDLEETTTKTTTTSITTTTTTKSAPASTTTTTKRSIEDIKALSFAEKSRLSILKKAQRKESSRNETRTKKPPVLLQVTNKMQTVVMVEPPTVMEPWVRAKEVSGDTPDRLVKVKRLMRHKIVASAKNIKDLTENWDDMVCDYVDVSLLDSAANSHCVSLVLIFAVILL